MAGCIFGDTLNIKVQHIVIDGLKCWLQNNLRDIVWVNLCAKSTSQSQWRLFSFPQTLAKYVGLGTHFHLFICVNLINFETGVYEYSASQ